MTRHPSTARGEKGVKTWREERWGGGEGCEGGGAGRRAPGTLLTGGLWAGQSCPGAPGAARVCPCVHLLLPAYLTAALAPPRTDARGHQQCKSVLTAVREGRSARQRKWKFKMTSLRLLLCFAFF